METFRTLGYELPKVAVLCCKETVDQKMPETLDARALKEACQAGEFGACFVEGPVSYDIAMSKEIAAQKKFDCPYCEDFDILASSPTSMPATSWARCWTVILPLHHGRHRGGRQGAPSCMTSRGSSAEEKYLSIALAGMVAALTK